MSSYNKLAVLCSAVMRFETLLNELFLAALVAFVFMSVPWVFGIFADYITGKKIFLSLLLVVFVLMVLVVCTIFAPIPLMIMNVGRIRRYNFQRAN